MTSFHHYLPINEELFDDGFYVTGGGRTQIAPGSPYPPRWHPALYHFNWNEGRFLPEFALILITTGKGVFESKETRLRKVCSGDAILLFPGVWHRYRPDPKTGWTEKWIQFSGAFAHKLWHRGLFVPERPLYSPPTFCQMEAAMENLLTSVERHPGFNSLQYSLQVSHLLALLIGSLAMPARTNHSSQSSSDDGLAAAAQDYIWTYSQRSISVGDIASHLGVGRRTLERRFQATRGCTVLEEMTRCRFNRAERLIRETSLPVKTVVYLAGFGKTENMRQVFLKNTGLSPRAYRASLS